MPVIKSAIKKLRKDKKRTEANDEFRSELKQIIRKAKKSKKPEDVQKAFSLIDKASKKHLIHANRAARIKSGLSKILPLSAAPTKKKITKNAHKKATIKTPKK